MTASMVKGATAGTMVQFRVNACPFGGCRLPENGVLGIAPVKSRSRPQPARRPIAACSGD